MPSQDDNNLFRRGWFLRATRWARAPRVSIERLRAEISNASFRLKLYQQSQLNGKEKDWVEAVENHIRLAEKSLEEGRIFEGYESLFATERELIDGMSAQERRILAISLRAEVPKKLHGSWRKKAALQHLGNQSKRVSVAALQEASGHIQSMSQNGYLKIDLLKRQLVLLGSLLGLLTLFVVEMARLGRLFQFDLNSETWMGLAVLVGMLGGAFSAMLSVTHTSKHVKIPHAQRSAPLTLVRVLLGGAAAIPIYFFMRSGFIEFPSVKSELAPILTFAFLGGFSERWFLSKMEQVSGMKHGPEPNDEGKETRSDSNSEKAEINHEGKETRTNSNSEEAERNVVIGFRAGVGTVVATADGKVLQCQRADVPVGAWQFPQGGIEEGETPGEAAWRELEEEIGVTELHLDLEGQVEDWLAYELPAKMQNAKVGQGQTQKWYLFRISATGRKQIELSEEFNEYRWVSMQQAIDDVAEFRKPIYERLKTEFSEAISNS